MCPSKRSGMSSTGERRFLSNLTSASSPLASVRSCVSWSSPASLHSVPFSRRRGCISRMSAAGLRTLSISLEVSSRWRRWCEAESSPSVLSAIWQTKPLGSCATMSVLIFSLIITRFTQAVVKSRPLKKIGAEQILLDIQAVKACLLDLPGTQSETAASRCATIKGIGLTHSYNKYVSKHTGQLETMLKVILAPDVSVHHGQTADPCRRYLRALCRTTAY